MTSSRAGEAPAPAFSSIQVPGPAANWLKIRPPLVFTREHADLLVQRLDEVLAAVG